MKAFPPEVARRALAAWRGGDEAARSLERIATSGNDVWRFSHDGRPFILRLTHVEWRTPSQNAAECTFLEHVHARGANVARPVPSASGALVEVTDDASASVFTWADGEHVTPDHPRRNEAFFRAWGRALAVLHEAATTYDGPPRWDWAEEGLLKGADRLLPAGDDAVRAQRDELYERLATLPRTRASYGLIHADLGPQNFRYAMDGTLTAFDFGNLCASWFAYDVVIALSTLRREAARDRLRGWLLAGYEEVRPLDAAAWAERDTLLRLRVLYVYLSRLKWFGPVPTAEQRGTLAMLRELVLERVSWP